jgi:hypothetical protein
MYSSSNSFLGGTNSARPGQPPLGQQPTLQQPYSGFPPQGQQQQPQGGFAPQPTGFGGGNLQPQLTGYPQPQQQLQQQPTRFQQPQYTGYPPQSQPQQQQPPPPPPVPQIPTQFQQPQQQQQQQPPPQPQQQQPQFSAPPSTNLHPQQTSSQIAQSFQGAGSSGPTQQQQHSKSSKIPNIRLSFITAPDQAKFEQLFKSAVGDGQALDGWYTPILLGYKGELRRS